MDDLLLTHFLKRRFPELFQIQLLSKFVRIVLGVEVPFASSSMLHTPIAH